MSIQDTGVGITKEDQKKLFQPYSKVDFKAGTNMQGIGLGLSICKEIVEKNGGKISVFSAGKNHGTSFDFFFNLKQVLESDKTTNSVSSNDDMLMDVSSSLGSDQAEEESEGINEDSSLEQEPESECPDLPLNTSFDENDGNSNILKYNMNRLRHSHRSDEKEQKSQRAKKEDDLRMIVNHGSSFRANSVDDNSKDK